jgi:hypothetical protein
VPASYRIDKARGIVLTRYEGRLSDHDVLGLQRRLAADPEFVPALRQLIDMREIEELEITSEGIQRLAQGNPFGTGSRRAGVASKDDVYGVARMFEMMRQEKGDELRIFRSLDDALDWLGLERSYTSS